MFTITVSSRTRSQPVSARKKRSTGTTGLGFFNAAHDLKQSIASSKVVLSERDKVEQLPILPWVVRRVK